MKPLITGGAGFIGSNLVRMLMSETDYDLVVVDKLTYAGNLDSIREFLDDNRLTFYQTDICDAAALNEVFQNEQPDAVIHLAAESHVDRSIDGPAPFIQTNIVGTFNLLEAARHLWQASGGGKSSVDSRKSSAIEPSSSAATANCQLTTANSQSNCQLPTANPSSLVTSNSQLEAQRPLFLHISTDEVYGSLAPDDPAFTEQSPYDPSSPYSASKASSDHLAMAWHHTFDLPVIISHCTNNYGPGQHDEKLIPTVVRTALAGEPIPVYGDGHNIRDWLHVEDHCRGLLHILERGRRGQTYNFGGDCDLKNIDLVRTICRHLDQLTPRTDSQPYEQQITFVSDRPGHDHRYAINHDAATAQFNWQPDTNFQVGLRKTVQGLVAQHSKTDYRPLPTPLSTCSKNSTKPKSQV